jgi:hypothetical protein
MPSAFSVAMGCAQPADHRSRRPADPRDQAAAPFAHEAGDVVDEAPGSAMNRKLDSDILRRTMRLRSLSAAFATSLLASACMIVPVTVEGYDPDCRIVTRHVELQTVQIAALNSCSGQGCESLVLVGLGLTAASAIISGSIAVTGNIVYWAEHRADCPGPAGAT